MCPWIVSTDSIDAITNPGTPVTISLYNKETSYSVINNIKTTDLYTSTGIIPLDLSVPTNKNFLLNIVNNDEVDLTLPNNDKLTIVLDRDLDFKQSFDIIVDATDTATQNKQLEIYMRFRLGSATNLPVETKLLDTIDLPIYYNSVTQLSNTSKRWSDGEWEEGYTNWRWYK